MPKLKQSNVSRKGIVLLSGGIDSATCALYLKNIGIKITALTFITKMSGCDSPEIFFARKIAKKIGIDDHVILDISSFNKVVDDIDNMNIFVGGSINNCCPSYFRVAPMSVELMHLTAFMYAISHRIESVFWSIHKDDIQSKQERNKIIHYINMLNLIVKSIYGDRYRIETPFLEKRKIDVALLGMSLGLNIIETYSCSLGRSSHCGSCRQCLLRFKTLRLIEEYKKCANI